jgi:hypothetical protein
MLESEIIKILKSKRFSLYNEKKLQEEIDAAFIQHNIPATREYRFNAKDICDFFINGICLEINISGSAKAIYRQLERYADHAEVTSIILATNRTMGLPETINNSSLCLVKHLFCFNCGTSIKILNSDKLAS